MSSSAEAVHEALRTRIISGNLAPGTHLNEAILSKQLGVSRVPVREAIRALEAEGLAEAKRFTGSFVTPVPTGDAQDLFAIRQVIETRIVQRAAQRRAALLAADGSKNKVDITEGGASGDWDEQRALVAEVLALGDAAMASGDTSPLPELNVRFHHGLAELSGSFALIVLFRQISGSVERLFVPDSETRAQITWPEHHTIMAAIDEGDERAAAAALVTHVRASNRSYVKRVRSAKPATR